MRLPIAVLLFALASSAASAETIASRASVIDGDTIEIRGERIRILDVDALESAQPCTGPDGSEWRCGQQAALALSDWIAARIVTCETAGKDKYNRWLARCTVSGQDVAAWLAANGWAVPYRNCKCEVVRDAADRAKAGKLNIWSGTFMMPWEWRAQQANAAPDIIEPSASWRDQLTRIGDGGGMVYLMDILLGGLGAGLVLVLYLIVRAARRRPSRNGGNVSYAFPRRGRFKLPSQYLISSVILLAAVVLYLWRPEIFQLQGLVPQASSGSCNIKGNISVSGERIYHLPHNRYYSETVIDESRGESWFCSEAEARAAGWRPAKR